MQFIFTFETDLQDSMGTRRVIVGAILGSYSCGHSEGDDVHQVVTVFNLRFR